MSEAQYLAEGERRAHHLKPFQTWGWEVGGGNFAGFSRVLVCETRVPVPVISELADLRQVAATSEPQYSICKMSRLQDPDPLGWHPRPKMLPL